MACSNGLGPLFYRPFRSRYSLPLHCVIRNSLVTFLRQTTTIQQRSKYPKPCTLNLGTWKWILGVIVVVVQVFGKYMISRQSDP